MEKQDAFTQALLRAMDAAEQATFAPTPDTEVSSSKQACCSSLAKP